MKCKGVFLIIFTALFMSCLLSCSCRGIDRKDVDQGQQSYDLVYPADLTGFDLFVLKEIDYALFFDEKKFSIQNTYEDADYVCFYLRPVTVEDERPEKIVEDMENDIYRTHKLKRDFFQAIQKRNMADQFVEPLVTYVTDEKGLRIYYNDEASDSYPCILLAKLRSGESTNVSIRLNLRSDRNQEEALLNNLPETIPEIRYAVYAMPCMDPKPSLKTQCDLQMPPEEPDKTDDFKAGDSMIFHVKMINTGNIHLNDVYMSGTYGSEGLFGYFNDCIECGKGDAGPEIMNRYVLTEKDIERQELEVSINGWAMPDNPDQREPYQFQIMKKLSLKDIRNVAD